MIYVVLQRMKKLLFLLILTLLLPSCTSKNTRGKEIARAIQSVGEEYYNARNYTAALQNLLEAYKIIDDDPYLNNSLGLTYLAKEKYDLAEGHFKRALKEKKDFVYAKNNLGAVYMARSQWDMAIQCFEEVSQDLLYPYPEIPFSNIAWAYFEQKKYKQAGAYFKKSLEVKADFINPIHGLASILLETKSYHQTINYLQAELKKIPKAAILHSDLARAYEMINEQAQAKKYWKKVLKLAPAGSPLALEAGKRL